MFLGGQEQLGKIISKLEIDASDTPIRIKDVDKMTAAAQKEVDNMMRKLQAK